MTEQIVLLIHLTATAYMTGVIWVVQAVHYPLMASVGTEGFPAYQKAHMRRITPVVLVGMIGELVAAVWLVVRMPTAMSVAGVVLLAGIWVSTFALQVPCHAKLERGFDAVCHRRLVATNWLRTLLWSARCVLAAWMLATP